MDANNTQWVVKPNNELFKVYRWAGIRADLIHTPDWLRSLVNNWGLDEYTSFGHSLKLFYAENRTKSITANPGDFILRVGDRLIVLTCDAFVAIFMGEDQTVSDEKQNLRSQYDG